MGDKEILAELKKSYEYLQDIIDNQDEQLVSTKELETAQEIMARKYEEVYNRVKKENIKSLYYQKDIVICDNIYGAYLYVKDEMPLSEADMDWQKWWEDYDFLDRD